MSVRPAGHHTIFEILLFMYDVLNESLMTRSYFHILGKNYNRVSNDFGLHTFNLS